MQSSCFLDCNDSALCLVDSWESTTQPHIVLNSFPLPFLCSTRVSPMLEGGFAPLQGMAGAIGLSNFLLAFWIVSEYSLSSRSFKKSSQLSSIVTIRSLFCPFLLFSILSGFTNFRPNFWPHIMVWQSFESLSISPRTTNILSEVSLLVEWISWILSKSLTNDCLNRLSKNPQFSFLELHPDQYE